MGGVDAMQGQMNMLGLAKNPLDMIINEYGAMD